MGASIMIAEPIIVSGPIIPGSVRGDKSTIVIKI
jgi:hypothetical protein